MCSRTMWPLCHEYTAVLFSAIVSFEPDQFKSLDIVCPSLHLLFFFNAECVVVLIGTCFFFMSIPLFTYMLQADN